MGDGKTRERGQVGQNGELSESQITRITRIIRRGVGWEISIALPNRSFDFA